MRIRTPITARSVILLVAGFLLAGCEDPNSSPTTPTELQADLAAVQEHAETLHEIARAVALALQDQGLRQRIKNDMRRSPYPEHKVEFGRYVRGESGGILLAKMTQRTGRTRDEMLALIDQFPPLEFYMPVARHRATWRGGPDLLIATHRLDGDERAPRTAFDLQGRAVSLSAERAPETPTLVIGLSETDLSSPPDRSRYQNMNDAGGEAIGSFVVTPMCDPETAILPCDPPGGGGDDDDPTDPPQFSFTPIPAPTSSTQQRGIRIREIIHYMWTPNDHEPWDQGAPEFDLFFAATSDVDPAAELRRMFRVPEDPWSGSDDDNNSKPRYFAPEAVVIADWDVDYGHRLLIKCYEDDPEWFHEGDDVNINGTSELDLADGTTVTVQVSTKWQDVIGGHDDSCGDGNILIRTSTGEWTNIPEIHPDASYQFYWNGFNNGPRWTGFGLFF